METGQVHFEATASGAAIATAVTVGALQRNWGLVDISDDAVAIQIIKSGMAQYQGVIARGTWQ